MLGTSPLLQTPLNARRAAIYSTSDGRCLHDGAAFGELLAAVLPDTGHLSISSEQPKSRKRHVCATVKSLLEYCPTPLPAAARPKQGTALITGSTGPVRKGACDNDDDADLVSWARGH